MIGLDTSVLMRYLAQDDPDQSARANRLIETRCTRQAPGRVAIIVLCELVWVLRNAYRYDKAVIAGVLEQILTTVELEVENDTLAHQALSAYRQGPADFSDYVIAYANDAAGCEATFSFDRNLLVNDHVLEP